MTTVQCYRGIHIFGQGVKCIEICDSGMFTLLGRRSQAVVRLLALVWAGPGVELQRMVPVEGFSSTRLVFSSVTIYTPSIHLCHTQLPGSHATDFDPSCRLFS